MAEDPRILAEHLAQAEQHVRAGEHHVVQQREIVDELQRAGHDSTSARKLLDTYEHTLAAHIAHLDLIRREMAASE